MLIADSRNRVPIRLTEERWQQILYRHPEMEDQLERVLETLKEPDRIQKGDFGELLAIRLYPETPLTRKYLVVVYREISADDGFFLTAYFAVSPSTRRATIWKP